jgi:hypothetical protein
VLGRNLVRGNTIKRRKKQNNKSGEANGLALFSKLLVLRGVKPHEEQ